MRRIFAFTALLVALPTIANAISKVEPL